MSDDVSDIKALAKVMAVQFDDVKRRIDDQKQDLKERLEKSDAHFDKQIEKLENRFSGDLKDLNQRLNEKNVDIAVLKKETESTTKNWGSIVGLVAGSIASIIVTVITKAMGF